MATTHESVFLREAIDGLSVNASDIVVDATIGGAGHFSALMGKLGTDGVLIGIDADREAVARAEEAARSGGPTIHLVNDNFRNLNAVLDTLGIGQIDKALFDLGWSAYHLSSGKGFSFRVDEPLVMTYGEPEAGMSAAEVINSASEDALSDIFFTLGEERFARQIARQIVRTRKENRILTTGALAEAVLAGTPRWYHSRRIHPATKVFQALRMYVNDELGALREGLAAALTRLSSGGRVAVISFHSIEDRIVKTMLRDAVRNGTGALVTKKAIEPSLEERTRNPRARSAKLRIFERASLGSASPADSLIHAYA